MKRNLCLFFAAMLAVSMLAGCVGTTVVVDQPTTEPTKGEPTATPTTEPTTEPTGETTDGETGATSEGTLKLGLAILPSLAKSKSAAAEENGKADFDVSVVAVLVDDNGVIQDCIIDAVATSVKFNAAGEVVDFDETKEILTKNELGEDYGMKKFAGSKYEWNEQAEALAQYAVGKTAQELRSGAIDESGKALDADLASVATISLGSYVNAIEKAVANAQNLGTNAGDVLKLAVINAMSAAAAGEKDGTIQLTVDVTAITMNGETITACTIDSLQAKVSFDTTGVLTTDVTVAPQTKNELGENYGMKKFAGSKYEWNEQAANFAAYVTGKTAAEVAGIAINEATKPAEDTDLAASVTISIGGFQALIAKAAQ